VGIGGEAKRLERCVVGNDVKTAMRETERTKEV